MSSETREVLNSLLETHELRYHENAQVYIEEQNRRKREIEEAEAKAAAEGTQQSENNTNGNGRTQVLFSLPLSGLEWYSKVLSRELQDLKQTQGETPQHQLRTQEEM